MPERAPKQDWYPQSGELPPRPRTRFLTPTTVGLMLVLFAACGFVGGVLVQKSQQSSSTIGLAGATTGGRFAGAGATGGSGAGGAGGRFASLFGGGAGSRGTIGTVTDVSGNKLYVTTTAGTMVEVITTPASKVTKSVSAGTNAIHPGDSVVVSGITASNGTVTAATVSDSGTGGGASSLLGGGSGAGSTTTSGSGSVSLFGG